MRLQIMRGGAGLVAAAAVFLLILFLFGSWFRPHLEALPAETDPEEVAAVEALRDVSFDPDHPVLIWRDVDYGEGPRAAWYPKRESPLLAEQVAGGLLPPLLERIGAEPMVVEGVDGIGRYGGTWFRVAPNVRDVSIINNRLAGAGLVRWSPLGEPIVPAAARRWEHNADMTEWTFHLRRGMRWSDGHPFTAHDYVYYFEDEVLGLNMGARTYMETQGRLGTMIALDDHTLRMTFPEPNPLLLSKLAGPAPYVAPRHYLAPLHPTKGNRETIRASMQARGLPTPRANYQVARDVSINPERPSINPWIRRSASDIPPITFVRNPYYWAVDSEGNQLPYVDQVLFEIRDLRALPLSAAGGKVQMQARYVEFRDYTLLMELRREGNYRLLHWFPATRSLWTLFPNLNRRIDADDPASSNKFALLNAADFRRALSLAINREDIIRADYSGIGEPAQVAPGRESPYHHEGLLKAYTEYDPVRASALLDGLGLTTYDREGYRTFPDGSRMVWFIEYTSFTGPGPIQFVIDAWRDIGIRAMGQERARPLFFIRKAALQCDFVVWTSESDFDPMLSARTFVPVNTESHHAIGYGRWFFQGGLLGHPEADRIGIPPPEGSDIRRAMELLVKAQSAVDPAERKAYMKEIFELNATNVWTISIATPPPQLVIAHNHFRNVPANAVMGHSFNTPANTGVETYFFTESNQTPAMEERVRQELAAIIPAAGTPGVTSGAKPGGVAGPLICRLFAGVALLAAALLALRHPFVGRRILWAVPTLATISVIVFVIIQAPPGSYLESYIMQQEIMGDQAALEEVATLRELFHLDEPGWRRYLRWMGFDWFLTFKAEDQGLLQGALGRSMETQRSVNQLVGDRILLTVAISGATILFTWLVALPIGIYSAVRQYSIGDYLFTFVGFIGLCIPNFLLALLLMYVSHRWFGVTVTGLFSPEFAADPTWSWAKFMDMLKHLWIPVIVLGTSGTAGMIRVMRANLLDELRKPYVTTARAKGVRPFKLLMKYPVRMALNPFVSGIGGIFPALMSGGAIVSIVLSLPTVGPLLLNALLIQDMYLAGSMLMVLSLLTVLGVLVSDLLLLALDPRIRMEGGSR